MRAVWVRRWESGARWGEMLAYCLLAIVGDVRRNGRGPWTGAMDGRKREDTPADMAGFLGRTEGSAPRLPGMKGLYLHAYALSMLHMSMWRYIFEALDVDKIDIAIRYYRYYSLPIDIALY